MDRTELIERCRVDAERLVGVDVTDIASLHDRCVEVLGYERSDRIVELLDATPLTRRAQSLGSVAALIVGTRELGADWWVAPGGAQADVPDAALLDDAPLEALEWRVSDAVADATWGPPVDWVDLNHPAAVDVVAAPQGSSPGERVTVAFDPGGRLDALIEPRPGGQLGTRLDLGTARHSAPATASWAAAIAACRQKLVVERVENPWTAPIGSEAAELHRWAVTRFGAQVAGAVWESAGDAFDTLVAAGWPWDIPADAWTWRNDVVAAIDRPR